MMNVWVRSDNQVKAESKWPHKRTSLLSSPLCLLALSLPSFRSLIAAPFRWRRCEENNNNKPLLLVAQSAQSIARGVLVWYGLVTLTID